MIPSKNHQNLIIPKKSIFDFVEVEYMKMEEMTLEKSCDPPPSYEKKDESSLGWIIKVVENSSKNSV